MRLALVTTILAGCGRFGFDDGPRDAVRDVVTEPMTYADEVLRDGPLAYYRFEGGATAVDAVGGAAATIEGQVAYSPGVVGAGLTFDGSTTRVVLGDRFGFGSDAPYTLEMWVKPRIVDTQVRFLIDRVASASPMGFQVYIARDFTQTVRRMSLSSECYASAPGLVGGRQAHIVVTFESGALTIYVDGVGYPSSNCPAWPAAPAGGFVMGDLVAGQFFKYDGLLDEVAIYGTALAPARVLAHYQAR